MSKSGEKKRICILVSHEEPTSIFQQDGYLYQNPAYYVDTYKFDLKPIKKEDEVESIKELLEEGYDWVWSFLWGSDSHHDSDVAGQKGTKYLESISYPFIGSSSKFLNSGKLELKSALLHSPPQLQFLTPSWIVGSELNKLSSLAFPVIVKPAYGLSSLNMTKESVCHNKLQVVKQVDILRSKISSKILIEEYISGVEMSVMLLETKDNGSVTCKPIVYSFDSTTNEAEQFFDYYNKNHGIDNEEISFKLFEESSTLENEIKEACIRAYEALGVVGSGYARIDVRVTKENKIYVLEVNPAPAFFAEPGNHYGDDFIICNSIPGGHEAVVKSIIESKQRFSLVHEYYKQKAQSGNQDFLQDELWKSIVCELGFSGFILDIGCGAGNLGKLIKENNPNAQLIGIDVCSEMCKPVYGIYEKIHIGLVENIIMELESNFDHIIGGGIFQYVDPRNFKKILYKAFSLAKSSITFTVEDITPEYQEKLLKIDTCNIRFNHLESIKNIQQEVAQTWYLSLERKHLLFVDEESKEEVFGITVQFRKQ